MTKLSGYRNLSEEEVDLINQVKAMANKVGELTQRMKDDPTLDQRWVSVGTTELQKGFMSLVRSVAQPSGF